MSPEKVIYPIFLPHAGCPFQCVYCNQRAVVPEHHRESDIVELTESCLRTYSSQVRRSGRRGEIAFFGGTFSALPAALIESVLTPVSLAVREGIFTGIRFSTRPDCLEDEVVELLSRYPIRTVELGVQSLSDSVLLKVRRGYGAGSVYDAVRRVRDKRWKLGIQLMAGLPGENEGLFIDSVDKAIGIGPDFLRIYPTLVLEGTGLAELFRRGCYSPLSLDEAVGRVAAAYDLAIGAKIPVIRMGLQPDPALEKPGVILAGPYHPAFGCLVKSRWWRDRVDRHFASLPELAGGSIILRVASNQLSDVIGHRRANVLHWKERWSANIGVTGDSDLSGFEIVVEKR